MVAKKKTPKTITKPGAVGIFSPVGKVTTLDCGCSSTVKEDHHLRWNFIPEHNPNAPAPNPYLVRLENDRQYKLREAKLKAEAKAASSENVVALCSIATDAEGHLGFVTSKHGRGKRGNPVVRVGKGKRTLPFTGF